MELMQARDTPTRNARARLATTPSRHEALGGASSFLTLRDRPLPGGGKN